MPGSRRALLRLIPVCAAFAVRAGRARAEEAVPASLPTALEARVYDDHQGHRLPYRLFVPKEASGKKKVPLVLFLHGAGERGDDNVRQVTGTRGQQIFIEPQTQARWPAFFVAPQCPRGEQWVALPWGEPSGKGKAPAAPTWPMAAALSVVERLLVEFPAIDRKRIYVTGLSMGGYGTWDALVRRPKLFRAGVPICGGYDETKARGLARLPIWAFHAEDDAVVPVARSRAMIEALRAAGGHPLYTEYPASLHYGHHSWDPAYGTPDLLPWLFDGRRPARP